MTKSLNWGLLGTARINRSLIPPLRLSVRNNLLAVASRTQKRADAYAAEWSIPRAHGSYEALLADPEIDVIYIPLPNQFHSEWAIKAAKAGKHVLCEKPLALSVEEVDLMEAAAKEANTLLVEAFMYRFHNRTLKIKEMVDAGYHWRPASYQRCIYVSPESPQRCSMGSRSWGRQLMGCRMLPPKF